MKTLTLLGPLSLPVLLLAIAPSGCGDDPITLAEIISAARDTDAPSAGDTEEPVGDVSTEADPTPVADDPPVPSEDFPQPQPTEEQAVEILLEYCGDCHNAPDAIPPSQITDIEALLARDYIVEGSRLDSPIYVRMVSGSMPPAYWNKPVPAEDIEYIGLFIDTL